MDPCHLGVHKAVLENRPERIKRLVEGGEHVNKTDYRGFTPLHIAAEEGNAEIVCLLVRLGADMEASCNGKKRPLHICAVKDTTESARCLLESGADKEAPCKKRWTALHLCAHHGTTATAEILLESEANKNAADKKERTPLHLCAERGTAEVARALLCDGANIEALNGSSSTPLHVCVEAKKTDVLIVLLEHGANVDAADEIRRTALHIAAEHNYVDITRRLLEEGAKPNRTNKDGDTALFVAVENGCCGVVIEMLRHDPEGIIHARDPWDKTPLHVAVTLGHDSIARALITAGARKDLEDKAGKTPCDYVKDEQESLKEVLAACHARDAGEAGNLDDFRACAPSADNQAPAARNGHASDVEKQKSSLSSHPESQSEESSCFSSVLEETWTPDNPFGSKSGMLKRLQLLRPRDVLADSFVVCTRIFDGKPHIKEARRKFGKREAVIIKFYWEEDVYNRVQATHSALDDSDYVCRMLEHLNVSRTGFPPSLVFEKGSRTLRDWLMTEVQSPVDKRWCLRQVLLGLREAHNHGFVHGDIKPSNIVWFGEEGRWKLIDWDGAQKEGAGTVVTMTPPYSAPEITATYHNFGVFPVARKSLDVWSVGITAYEILTGTCFFENGTSLEDIVALTRDEAVDRKLEQIQDAAERDALSNFLKIAPARRWTVADALQHDLFDSDDQTTMELEDDQTTMERVDPAGPGSRPSDMFPEQHTYLGFFLDWIKSLRRQDARPQSRAQ